MFSGIDFLLERTMSSFFDAIKNLLTAYHIDKSSTGKIIEPSLLNFAEPFFLKERLIMKKGYMQLPHNVHETMIFMGIVSIISVNIIAPLISMFETSFSWHNYLMTLSIIPFMWMAVIIIVLLAQKPATVLKKSIC